MPVKNLANSDVVTADEDTAVTDIAGQMGSEGVGAVVIVEGDEPTGLVTDRQIALAAADQDDLSSLTAGDVMTEDPATINGDEEGIEISRALNERKVRRLPVVDDDGKLTGIVTFDDVVATIGEQMADVSDVIEAQSPDYSPSDS